MNDHGKVPPQAVDIEQAVLGAILVDKNNCIAAMKMLTPEMFYREAHQKIYEVIDAIQGNIDVLIVAQQLTKKRLLDEVGGAYYLSQLTKNVTSGANSDTHAKIIIEKYIRRLYIKYTQEIQRLGYDESVDVFDLQSTVNNLFQDIDKAVAGGGSMKHIAEVLNRANDEMEARIKQFREGEQTGIDTGITSLNTLLCGWQNSDLVVVAARPGMGKTAVALQFAFSAASQGRSVCIYSLEMSDVRLVDRLILKATDLDANRFKSGMLEDYELAKYNASIGPLTDLPIYIDDNPIVSMDYIAANSALMKQQKKCDFVIIDYLQLAETRKERGKSREQEVSEASRKAKIIAKNLDVPVILLSQLSRSVETRGGDRRPGLSDLRDSGAIEQDADIVMFIYRPEYYRITEDADGNSTRGYGELIVAKHRNGNTDTVPFWYNPSMTQISDFTAQNTGDFINKPEAKADDNLPF